MHGECVRRINFQLLAFNSLMYVRIVKCRDEPPSFANAHIYAWKDYDGAVVSPHNHTGDNDTQVGKGLLSGDLSSDC